MTERDLKDMLTRSHGQPARIPGGRGPDGRLGGHRRMLERRVGSDGRGLGDGRSVSAAARARPPPSARRVRGGVGSRRRAVLRRRRPADHVQLVAVHLPGQHRQVQGRVRDQEVPVRHLRQQRRPDGQAPGRRDRLRHRVADDELPAGDDRGGLPPEARHVADPEHRADQPDVPQAVVGSDRGIRRSQGLRDDRHPLSLDADPVRADVVEGLLRHDHRPVVGQGDLRRLPRRRVHLPAQDARLLAQLGRAEPSSRRPARSCSRSRRTCTASTRTPTARRWPTARPR